MWCVYSVPAMSTAGVVPGRVKVPALSADGRADERQAVDLRKALAVGVHKRSVEQD